MVFFASSRDGPRGGDRLGVGGDVSGTSSVDVDLGVLGWLDGDFGELEHRIPKEEGHRWGTGSVRAGDAGWLMAVETLGMWCLKGEPSLLVCPLHIKDNCRKEYRVCYAIYCVLFALAGVHRHPL